MIQSVFLCNKMTYSNCNALLLTQTRLTLGIIGITPNKVQIVERDFEGS